MRLILPKTINSMKKKCILVIDSIQTMYLPQLDSSPGSVSQVRGSANELILAAKKTNNTNFNWSFNKRWCNSWTKSIRTYG